MSTFNDLVNLSLNTLLSGLPFFVAALWLTHVYMEVAKRHGVQPLQLTRRSHSDMLATLPRKELQAKAKAEGIKANGRSSDIISQLARW